MEFKDKYRYKGWDNCIYVANNIIDFVATSDIGPRIIRLGFKEKLRGIMLKF